MTRADADEILARVVLRDLRPDDTPALVDILDQAFVGWMRSSLPAEERRRFQMSHFKWKASIPGDEPNLWVVTELDSKPVGVLMLLPRRARIHGRERTALGGGNLALLPELQGIGLHRIASGRHKTLRQRFDLAYWQNSTEGYRAARARRGGSPPMAEPMYVFFKPFDVQRTVAQLRTGDAGLAKRIALSLAVHGAKTLAWLSPRAYRRPQPRSWSIRQVQRFDERVDRCFDAAASQFDFIFVRDAEYLNWRHLDPRAGQFSAFEAVDSDGSMLGYVICKVEDDRGYIADLLALPDRTDVARSLIEHALAHFRDAGLATVLCALPRSHPYVRTLRRYGFLPSRRSFGWFAATGESMDQAEMDTLREPGARIHLTYADGDSI